MKININILITAFFLFVATCGQSQAHSLKLNPEKEKAFSPYMVARHGGTEGLAEFKKNKPQEYLKELWYYSESFYVKRNHLSEGVSLDESIIDISRFESNRKSNVESLVVLPGFKDALVLMPADKLLFKP